MTRDPRYDRAFSETNLRRIFDTKIQGSGSVGRDGLTAARLSTIQIDSLISSASSIALAGNYVFSPYRQMLKLKGAGKAPRQIAIPGLRDRIVLRAMAEYVRVLETGLELKRPQEVVSGVRTTIHGGAARYFARFDVVNFYPSISHAAIRATLSRVGADPRFLDLVSSAISTPILADGASGGSVSRATRGVPPGVSLSNVLGELILHDLDEAIDRIPGASYFRYVDDVIVFASRFGAWRAGRVLKSQLRRVGLKAHSRRTEKSATGSVGSASIEYLGYTFYAGRVTVSLARAQRLISSMARPVTAYRYAISAKKEIARVGKRSEWWMNLSITGCKAGGTRRGWLPYYSQLDDVALLHRLDGIAVNLMSRIPVSYRFKPKSFVRAYTLTRNPARDKKGYIPNLDDMSYREKRALLKLASKYDRIPTKKIEVDKLFARFVGTAIASLETDVGSVS